MASRGEDLHWSGAREGGTEGRHPAAPRIERESTEGILRIMSAENRRAAREVDRRIRRLAWLADSVAATIRSGGRVFLVGSGTSGRLCAAEAAEIPPTFGLRPSKVQAVLAGGYAALKRAVESAEDDDRAAARELTRRRLGPRDLVLGVSAGGRTPFVLGALRRARAAGAATALISCSPVPGAIVFETGPEIVAGSTRLKAGTATKMALNMITTAAMIRLHRACGGWMVGVRMSNRKLRRRAVRIVRGLTGCSETDANAALRAAGGDVKLAAAFWKTGSLAAARKLLAAHGGCVIEALR